MVRQLLERRVPQLVALYVVGGWGVVQFVDWLVDQYLLSPTLTNLVFALLIFFLPSAIVIAWRHGAPGHDPWKRRDAGVIGLNVLVAAVISVVLFRDAELGRAAEVRLFEGPDGTPVERTVPNPAFRRRLLIFAFSNRTGDVDLDWMATGLGFGTYIDLLQDPAFQLSYPPVDSYVRDRLQAAGLQADDDVPLPLMREIARSRGMPHFVDGEIHPGRGDTLTARIRLYDAESARTLSSHTYAMTDPRAVADSISMNLREDLGIPDAYIERSLDLPVADVTANPLSAYAALSEAFRESTVSRDLERARELAEQAIAMDSTSPLSYMTLASVAKQEGDETTAEQADAGVAEYDYRLPEPIRLREQVYALQRIGDDQGALRTASYLTEVYPGDPSARRLLAEAYRNSGDNDGWRRELGAAVEIDPSYADGMWRLASSLMRRDGFSPDSAARVWRRVIELRPGDPMPRLNLAAVMERAGRIDDAREEFAHARVVFPRNPWVFISEAAMELRFVNWDRAEELRAEGADLVRTDREKNLLIWFDELMCYLRGRYDCLVSAYRLELDFLSETRGPAGVIGGIHESRFLHHAAEFGRASEAFAQIDSLRRTVDPSFAWWLLWPEAKLAVATGDVDRARSVAASQQQVFDQRTMNAGFKRNHTAWLAGQIAWLEDGNCRRALQDFEKMPDGAWDARLRCYTELGRWNDAERVAQDVMAINPGNISTRYLIARYYAARGEKKKALDHLDVVLDAWDGADPSYRPAIEARALVDSLRAGL